MMEILELLAAWILELIQIFLCASIIFSQKIIYHKKQMFIVMLFMVIFLGATIASVKMEPIILLVITIFLFLVLLEGRKEQCFMLFLVVYWLINVVNYFSSVLLSLVSGKSCYDYWDEYPEIFIRSVCSILLIFLVSLVIKKQKDFIRNLPISFYRLAGLGGGVFFFCVMPAIQFGHQVSNRALQNVIVIGSALSELQFYMVLLAYFTLDRKCIIYQNENHLKNLMLQASKDYCKEILENEREVRKLHHDMKHHITTMKYFLLEKKYQELSEYMEDIDEEIGNAFQVHRMTGNEILDAVLTRYVQREPEISFQVEGELSKVTIRDYDLCVIFSNAVANAVEACRRLKEKEKVIEIYLKRTGDNDIFIIKNPVEWKVDVKGLGNITTKEDIANHGYGIARIRETAKKYDGSVEFQVKEQKFEIDIILMENDRSLQKTTVFYK